MKKFIIITFSLTIFAAMVLTGCNSSSGTKGEVYPQIDPEATASIQKETDTSSDAADETTSSNTAAPDTEPGTSDYIGEEKAKEIALSHAKFKESEVQMLHTELDRDDGISEYEVDFYVGNVEYNYEINAKNGQIISFESEIED